MDTSLQFKEIRPTEDVHQYVRNHAQNDLILLNVRSFLVGNDTKFFTIVPAQETISEQDLTELSVGWKIFPPDSVYRAESRSELIQALITQFLASADTRIVIFPSEFTAESKLLKGYDRQIIQLSNYPYLWVDKYSSDSVLRAVQNISQGFFYNALLLEADQLPDSWENWLNQKSVAGTLSSCVGSLIMEAYDNDSFLLIVPDHGTAVLDTMKTCLTVNLSQEIV